MTDHHTIDFDKELAQGQETYNGKVGDWWLNQSNNEVHDEAYRNIAQQIRLFYDHEPQLIVDYACGSGVLLANLLQLFPETEFIGIDGSAKMIDQAQDRIIARGKGELERVEFWEAHLPDFDLPKFKADAVIFCFPNICPYPDDQPYYDEHGGEHPDDLAMAQALATAREKDPEMETVFDEPETLKTALMDAKVIARNLRRLVRKGGHCFRMEYSNAEREELSKLVQMRLNFEGGCLGKKFKGIKAEKIFKLVQSTYFESEVIQDVYHQTGDEDNLEGGYLVNVIKAV